MEDRNKALEARRELKQLGTKDIKSNTLLHSLKEASTAYPLPLLAAGTSVPLIPIFRSILIVGVAFPVSYFAFQKLQTLELDDN
jgi:hypothetical protein